MNKELRELLDKFNQKIAMAKGFMEEGENKDLDKAAKLMDEADEIKKEFNLKKRLYDKEKEENTPTEEEYIEKKKENEKKEEENKEKDSIKEFAEAARNLFYTKNTKDMSEDSNLDGGYTVPEDIQTQIEHYREAKFSLRDVVEVKPTTKLKGSRTFKKRSQQTGFTKVGEKGKITGKNTPQFERINYKIEKYAGYFAVTNELLEDSDADIVSELTAWIGDESRVTGNKLILEEINKKVAVELKGIDDIKKAVNVTLGQAFAPTSRIYTNDDGLQYFDTLKDSDGKYLLSPDPTNPMEMSLNVGARKIPIKVIPNNDLNTTENKIPVIIGDLYEGIRFMDRKQMNIKASDVAVIGDLNAYEEDLTIFRAIEREDVITKDAQAFVNGYITVAE